MNAVTIRSSIITQAILETLFAIFSPLFRNSYPLMIISIQFAAFFFSLISFLENYHSFHNFPNSFFLSFLDLRLFYGRCEETNNENFLLDYSSAFQNDFDEKMMMMRIVKKVDEESDNQISSSPLPSPSSLSSRPKFCSEAEVIN